MEGNIFKKCDKGLYFDYVLQTRNRNRFLLLLYINYLLNKILLINLFVDNVNYTMKLR